MDHTDHFRFHHFFDFDLIFSIKIWLFEKKSLFEISVKKGDFIGSHMLLFWRYYIIYIPVFLKASGCVSYIGPPAAFFRENDISGFFRHVHFLKKWIFLIFQKWLPRPNHSAHMKGIEILCKTPVSKFPELPPGPNSIGTNSKYSSPARMSTWISRWRRRRRRRRRRPKNPPHLVRPLEYHVQGANIPCGRIPHFDVYFWQLETVDVTFFEL